MSNTHAPASFVKVLRSTIMDFIKVDFFTRADNVKIYIGQETETRRITFLQGGGTGGQLMD